MNILDPQGPIAAADKTILIDSIAIMLAIVVPTIVAIFVFAWYFRRSNVRAFYWPDWEYSGRLELVVWSIPALTIILLGGVAWIGSHQLDPARPVEGTGQGITIQAVSLDWKWLFIYPDHGVAAVNQLVIPAGTPVEFQLTSATVMNSFFVPQLGSQIYTMGGMTTHLNLLADKPGEYPGFSANYSGDGFSEMRFVVKSVPTADFNAWLEQARATGSALDEAGYAELTKPSKAVPPTTYRSVGPNLFEHIIEQTVAGPGKAGAAGGASSPPRHAGG